MAEIIRIEHACFERARELRHRARVMKAEGRFDRALDLNGQARAFDSKAMEIARAMDAALKAAIRECEQWRDW